MSEAADRLVMPYPGLRPFEREDHPIFFGREAQVSALLGLLEDHAFVAVLGSSGCGKSSLVRAGLLQALAEGFPSTSTGWRFVVMRPGDQPYRRLVQGLAESLYAHDDTGARRAPDEVAKYEDSIFRTVLKTDRGLRTVIEEAIASPGIGGGGEAQTTTKVLLVIDQFEELFAFRRTGTKRDSDVSRDEAAAFVNTILRSCSAGNSPLRVVLTMRSDFVGHCEAFLGLPEAVSRSQFLVPRLDRSQMEEAITRPGAVEGTFRPFTVDSKLVTRIINDAGDRPDQLPLMQHALMRTWKFGLERSSNPGIQQRSAGFVLIEKDYDRAGGIAEALSLHAEEAWARIKDDQRQQEIARRLFLLLCDATPDGITRRRPRFDEVEAATGATRKEIESVIRLFREDDRNFLVLPRDGPLDASERLDISHEALLRQWPRFEAWQEEERQDSSELLRLVASAKYYYSPEKTGGLLPADDLDRINNWHRRVTLSWARRYLPRKKPSEQDEVWTKVISFIENSRKVATIQIRKRLAFRISLLALAASILVVYAVVTTRANREIQGILTNSFIKSLGGFSPELAVDERLALWELSELPGRHHRVRENVITRWLETEEGVLKTLEFDDVSLQAAAGLHVALHRQIASRANAFAEHWATVLENPQSGSRHDPRLPKVVAKLAPRMESSDAARVADRLVKLLDANTAGALVYLASKLEYEDAARIADGVLRLTENPQIDPGLLPSLGDTLAALGARLKPADARQIADRLARILEDPRTSPDRLSSLAIAIPALSKQLGDDTVRRTVNNLVKALDNPQSGIKDLPRLSNAVASLADKLDPSVATGAASRLLQALESLEIDLERVSALSRVVAAASAKIQPSQAAATLDGMINDLDLVVSNKSPQVSAAAAALASGMEPLPAKNTAERLAKLLESSTRDAERLSNVSHILAALASRMEPAQAAAFTERIIRPAIQGLENRGTRMDQLSRFSRIVVAFASTMEPKTAADIANRLNELIANDEEKTIDVSRATRVYNLTRVVAALASRIERDAGKVVARSARIVAKALENPDLGSRSASDLGYALGQLSKMLPEKQRSQIALLALSNMLLVHPGVEAIQEWKEIESVCQQLSKEDLVEVLKWPFTVGMAQRIVLKELDFDGDVLRFAEQAPAQRIKGADSPATRPKAESVKDLL